MFRLETLGGLSLTADAEPLRTTQRRRLALLALLAVAGERGLSRDKVQAYLWPESPSDNARHALEQLLYGLRRQLGDEAFLGTNPLALNPVVVGSDVGDFERALERDAPAEAVALYRGPFLDGFFLTDASEFERWAEGERARLAQRCMTALESLAQRAAERDTAAALESWRRLVAMDPYATGPTLGLMGALAARGDRAGALEAAQVHETLMREELAAVPDPAIAALAEQLRVGQAIGAAQSPRQVGSPLPQTPVPSPVLDAPITAAADSTSVASAKPTARPRALERRSIRLAAGGAVALGLALLGSWAVAHSHSDPRTTGGTADAARVVVVPFRVSAADSGLAYLREGIVDLLAAKLTGEGGPAAVDARTTLSAWRREAPVDDSSPDVETARRVARDLGARLALGGVVVRTGATSVVLSGTLLDASDGLVRARATARGALDSLPTLVDRLAATLLALNAGENERRVAGLTTASLTAVQAYLDGRAAYRRGHYASAVARFERALSLDSTFALAALELASAAEVRFLLRPIDQALPFGWWVEIDNAWSRGVELAWRERDGLSAEDRRYLETLRGSRSPNPTPALEQLRNWERAVQVDPDRADAWYRFGVLLLYQGPAADVADARERARVAFERARALDSGFVAPVAGLLEVAAFSQDTSAVRRLGALYLNRDSTGDDADYVRWRVATLIGDGPALERLRARFDSMGSQSLARIQWTSQVDGIAIEDAEHAIAVLVRRAGDLPERARAIGEARWLALNRGHPQAALRLDDSLVSLERRPYWSLGFRIVYALYWDADTGAVSAAVRKLEGNLRAASRLPGPRDGPESFRPELWRLSHGDWSLTPRIIVLLRMAGARDSAASGFGFLGRQADVLETVLAAETERPDAPRLLEHLDSLARQGCCGTPHYTDLVVARLRERAGDLPGALRAVRRARWVTPPEYLSASLREEGRLAALTGDRAGAMRAYRHFLVLQDSPEPSLRGEVERVRAELEGLEAARR